MLHSRGQYQRGEGICHGFNFRFFFLIKNLQVSAAVIAAFGFNRGLFGIQRPLMQFAALLAVAAFYAHYVPFGFTQVAVQGTQTLSGANLHHAGPGIEPHTGQY